MILSDQAALDCDELVQGQQTEVGEVGVQGLPRRYPPQPHNHQQPAGVHHLTDQASVNSPEFVVLEVIVVRAGVVRDDGLSSSRQKIKEDCG